MFVSSHHWILYQFIPFFTAKVHHWFGRHLRGYLGWEPYFANSVALISWFTMITVEFYFWSSREGSTCIYLDRWVQDFIAPSMHGQRYKYNHGRTKSPGLVGLTAILRKFLCSYKLVHDDHGRILFLVVARGIYLYLFGSLGSGFHCTQHARSTLQV